MRFSKLSQKMTFLYFYFGFFFGCLFAYGSRTPICHDGDVDLIFLMREYKDVEKHASVIGYFAKRESNATGDLRIAIVDISKCRFLLDFTIYTSLEELENKTKYILPNDVYSYCDTFPFLKKHIDQSGEKKTFLIWRHYSVKALGVIRRFQNFKEPFRFLYHIYFFYFHPKPDYYYKPKPNIHHRTPDSDVELIGAKFCRACPKGWITFTSPQKPHVSSCYFFDVRNSTINWIQARDECRKNDSILVSFEMSEELEYVFNAFHLPLVQPSEDTLVYIGLISKRDGGVNVLRWTSGGPYNLPLRYTENFIGNYDLEVCILLKCVTANNKLGENSTSTPCNEQNIELVTLSCLQERTNVFVCELEMAREFKDEDDRIKIPSLDTTLAHTEFVKVGNNIVSVSNKEHKRPEFRFDCGDNLQPVPYGAVCDKVFDCDNGMDEQYCYENSERKTYEDRLFRCLTIESDWFRISRSRLCDGIIDCADGVDESQCDKKKYDICSDGTVVPIGWLRGNKDAYCFLCNGCNNTNSIMAVKSNETDNCAFPSELTYGVTICEETLSNKGTALAECENKLHNKRWTPSCLYIRRSTDVSLGCPDKSHLQDCQLYKCPDDFIKCPHDYCIPVYYINDGIMDCRYGEDETQNINMNRRGYFMCNSGNIFLHPNNICDGEKQCLDGEDELNCDAVCPEGFKCEGGVAFSSNFETISTTFKSNFSYINITNHKIRYFFDSSVFRYLFKLVLSKCGILNIDNILIQNFWEIMYSLYYIDVSYNEISEIYETSILIVFPNLRFLNLSHNNNLRTFMLEERGSKRLNTLDLSYTKLSVLHLPVNDKNYEMKHLCLYKTKIINLGWLNNIKYVEYLDIRDTLLTNDGLSPDDLSNISIKVSLQTDMFKLCCPSYRGPGVPAHVCSSPSDAVSSCDDLLSDTLKRALLWMVATIAFVGNITVIYYRVFHDRGVFKKAYGVFVTNLGVSDLLMSTYLFLIATVDVHYRDVYVINEAYWRHSDLCKAAGFLSTLSSETSTFFIFLITVDRFLVMRYPFGNHGFNKWGITLSVVSTWCAGIIMALLPLTFDTWELYSSNGLCLGMPLTVTRLDGWPYSFAIFIVLNLCMFLLIALGQVAIFRSMSSSREHLTNSHATERRLQDVSVAKKLSLVVLSNFLCWFPICVTGLRSKFGVDPNPETLAWLLVLVLPLNAAVNPMIYTIPAVFSKWQVFKQAGYHFTRRSNIARR